MENPVIIFGAGNLGAVALDIFEKNGIIVYGFLDDDTTLHQTLIGEIAVLGTTEDEGFTKLIGKKCEAFIAIDDIRLRKNIAEMLNERRHIQPINALHPSVILANSASIGHGNMIAAGVVLGAKSSIGNHCILNTHVNIDADTHLADFVQIGTGSNIGTSVIIEEGAFVGAGVTIVGSITIGKNARIGAGSVVVESVAKNATVFGNPAKKI